MEVGLSLMNTILFAAHVNIWYGPHKSFRYAI